jgi:Flp pilus assembly pilin Flp
MDRFGSTLGALAAWVGQRVLWLRAALAESRPHEQGSERGQGLVEYALIISLIAILIIGALTFFGAGLDGALSGIGSDIRGVL